MVPQHCFPPPGLPGRAQAHQGENNKFSFWQGVRHNHDIFPYYLGHAKKVFPHLDCLDELKLMRDKTLNFPCDWLDPAKPSWPRQDGFPPPGLPGRAQAHEG
jgi:hypothetical protein